jgi:phage baseplate assembly protein W
MPTPSERYNEILNETRNEIHDRVRGDLTPELRRIIAEELQWARAQVAQGAPLQDTYDLALWRIDRRVTDRILEEQRRAAREEAGAHEEAALAALLLLGAGATATALADASGPLWGTQDGDLSVATPEGVGQSETSVRALVRSSIEDVAQDIDDILAAAQGEDVDLDPDLSELLDDIDRTDPTNVADAVTGAVAGEDVADALRRVGQDVEARGGKLENNLRRVLSHEVANAADDAGKRLAAQSGAVDLVEWTLSLRHDTLPSSPDVCDVLAAADPFGYGPGRYHPEAVPILPHPHCECRIEVVLVEPDDWPADRDVPDQPGAGDIDVEGIMQNTDGERTVTEAHVSNQSDMIDRAFRLAYEE